MSKVIGRGQRLIPEYLLKYLENQKENGVNITQLVDSNGNPRFIEGEGEGIAQEGITISYCKWSLSGTHLMLAVAGTIANNTTFPSNTAFGTYTLPDFIYNKIKAMFSNFIDRKSIAIYGTDYSPQTVILNLAKLSDNKIAMQSASTFTSASEKLFRFQFDLLIDSE